jgi:hypothetical protein
MSADRKPTTFAERSLARALARDAKRARLSQWPGSKRFALAALPPGWTLTRRNDWWILAAVPPQERAAAYAMPVEGQA